MFFFPDLIFGGLIHLLILNSRVASCRRRDRFWLQTALKTHQKDGYHLNTMGARSSGSVSADCLGPHCIVDDSNEVVVRLASIAVVVLQVETQRLVLSLVRVIVSSICWDVAMKSTSSSGSSCRFSSRFVVEACNKDGNEYQLNTLYGLWCLLVHALKFADWVEIMLFDDILFHEYPRLANETA